MILVSSDGGPQEPPRSEGVAGGYNHHAPTGSPTGRAARLDSAGCGGGYDHPAPTGSPTGCVARLGSGAAGCGVAGDWGGVSGPVLEGTIGPGIPSGPRLRQRPGPRRRRGGDFLGPEERRAAAGSRARGRREDQYEALLSRASQLVAWGLGRGALSHGGRTLTLRGPPTRAGGRPRE